MRAPATATDLPPVTQAATARRWASSPARATSWTPTGMPVPPVAAGMHTAGNPRRVHKRAKRESPLWPTPSGASPITAGVKITEQRANSSAHDANAADF